MKKLLVLALVLAVAGMANAGWSVMKSGSDATISGDYLNIDLTYALVSEDVSFVTVLGAGAPDASGYLDLASALGIPTPAGTDAQVWGIGSFSAIPNREGVPMFILSGITSQVDLYLVDDMAGTLTGSPIVSIVPEPMTMLLLGLGGLFLRRK